METKTNTIEPFLGDLETVIAGAQYFDHDVEPGTQVYPEREPENRRDAQAVRVDDEHGRPLGYVPHRIVSWLAPLMDQGFVAVSARRPSQPHERGERPALDLSIYLSSKGRTLLDTGVVPASTGDALHQMVLDIYLRTEQWRDPVVIQGMERQLQGLRHEELLPKTRMLLALFPYRIRQAQKATKATACSGIREALSGIRLGEPLHCHGLTLFPVFAPNGHEPEYLLLQEAIEAGHASVTETSESGTVPELKVVNRGGKPVLIPEGEIVTGAKQNRVVNITVLVAANSEFVLPVSCVERGRWHSNSREFHATHYAPLKLRAHKGYSVRESRMRTGQAYSDQGRVWNDVRFCLNDAGAQSDTESLTAAFEAARRKFGAEFAKLSLPEQATGVLVGLDGQAIGLDCFDCATTFRKLWPRLRDAYSLEGGSASKGKKLSEEGARAFLERFTEDLTPVEQPQGLGREFTTKDSQLVGSALWYGDRVVHGCAFPVR